MVQLRSPFTTAVIDVPDESAGKYEAAGWERPRKRSRSGKSDSTGAGGGPSGNPPADTASLEEWAEYALAQGKTAEELKDLDQEAVRALFAPTLSTGIPAGNASLEDWTAYALAQGKTAEDLNGLKRDDVRALFAE